MSNKKAQAFLQKKKEETKGKMKAERKHREAAGQPSGERKHREATGKGSEKHGKADGSKMPEGLRKHFEKKNK